MIDLTFMVNLVNRIYLKHFILLTILTSFYFRNFLNKKELRGNRSS